MKKQELSPPEWVAVTAGTALLFASVVTAVALPTLSTLEPWVGWSLASAAILGLLMLTATTVRALLRTDTEGIEKQDAARAALVAVLFIVVAGLCYALLEAFVGLPRLTAAVPAVTAALVWMVAFATSRPRGDA